ncbi:MAG: ESPR-type extended signal peptide-containing protein, partial [Megasphaera elsdenii]|nr:ESPR-type extended signal peptide-containing protein [Megasphaera elsdenii]
MNKVFKVIWSEARNAYVVVSEIAKNHGSKSCSTKKLLAMLIATGVMTCASVAPAMAANLAPTETKIEIGEDASASGEGSVAIGQKAVASNLVAIAIGRDAVASGVDSIAIGSDTKATQKFSVAVGNDIGFTAYAGTAVGQQAYASGDNATAIGTMTNIDTKYNASHDDWRKAGAQSTAIGAYAGSWGVASTAVGGFSKAEGKLATAIGYNSQANVDYGTALGDYSEVKAGWGVAIGASSFADRESHVVGLYAPDEDKDSLTWKANAGAVSVGSSVEGQEITRQITNVAAGSADTDAVNVAQLNAVKAAAGKKVSLVDGENTKATLVKDDATGTQYK